MILIKIFVMPILYIALVIGVIGAWALIGCVICAIIRGIFGAIVKSIKSLDAPKVEK